MDDLRALLEAATTVAFYDWPNQSVPATLDRAGYAVVGHEPDSAKSYRFEDPPPAASDDCDVFPLDGGGALVSRNIAALPERVDMVCTFRPPKEQTDIVRSAIALGAKAFWIEPGEGSSEQARKIAEAAGLAFVDGESIAAAVRRLGISKS